MHFTGSAQVLPDRVKGTRSRRMAPLNPFTTEVPPMTRLFVRVHTHLLAHPPRRPESGQTTAEYALVLLGVAAIALLVVAWATDTNRIGKLLDSVLDAILSDVT